MNDERLQHFEQMDKMLNIATALGLNINILALGIELGKDPKVLLDDFIKCYKQTGPHLAFYYNVANYGLCVLWKVELLVREIQKNPSFSSSPTDNAISDLWEVYREYKNLEDEYFNCRYIENFGKCDPTSDIIYDKIKVDIPNVVHRISDLELQLNKEKEYSAHLQRMVEYREEKLKELGVEI